MAGVGDLQALAVEYLEACEDAVASSPGGSISYSLVSPGIPVFDCLPLLAVYVGGAIEAETRLSAPPLQAGRRPDDMGSVHLIGLTCVVARCLPGIDKNMTFPSAAKLTATAAQTNGDLWAIWNVVRAMYREKMIFTRADGERRELFFDPAVPLSYGTGAGGWMIPIRVQIDGYGPSIGT